MATYEKNFKVKKGLDVSSGSINVTNDANSSSYADLAIFHTGNLEVGRIAYTLLMIIYKLVVVQQIMLG